MYSALANVVAVTHGLIVLCVVVGSVAAVFGLLRRSRRIQWSFCSLLVALILSDLLLGSCALTELEKNLRNAAQAGSAYKESFIGHYFPMLPPKVHDFAGPTLVVAGLAAIPYWRWRDRRSESGNFQDA